MAKLSVLVCDGSGVELLIIIFPYSTHICANASFLIASFFYHASSKLFFFRIYPFFSFNVSRKANDARSNPKVPLSGVGEQLYAVEVNVPNGSRGTVIKIACEA